MSGRNAPGLVVPVRFVGHGRELVMTQPSRNPTQTLLDLLGPDDDRSPGQAADRLAAYPQLQVRRYAVDQVVVLEVAGHLGDVVEDLDRAIQLALAQAPRGVACDLSGVAEDATPAAVGLLAAAGRHVRDWPGTPIAVACPDPAVRAALTAHPLGGHLIVTQSVLAAVSAVLSTPAPAVECLRLASHPTAPRASRDFVAGVLLKWQLGGAIPSVCLVASELVTNAALHAGTDIDVSVAWNQGALRLTVRDRSSDLPRQQHYHFDRHGRGLTIVAGLSRAFGILPVAYGGKVVWAVFDAPRPHSSPMPRRSVSGAASVAASVAASGAASGASAGASDSAAAAAGGSPPSTPVATPCPAGHAIASVPARGRDPVARRGGTDQTPLTTRPRTAQRLGSAHIDTSRNVPSLPYDDSSNYLG
jgi:hypothetical protein